VADCRLTRATRRSTSTSATSIRTQELVRRRQRQEFDRERTLTFVKALPGSEHRDDLHGFLDQKLLKEHALKPAKTPSGRRSLPVRSRSPARSSACQRPRDAHSHSVRKPIAQAQRDRCSVFATSGQTFGRGRHRARNGRGHHSGKSRPTRRSNGSSTGAKRRHTRLSRAAHGVRFARFRKPTRWSTTRFRHRTRPPNSEARFVVGSQRVASTKRPPATRSRGRHIRLPHSTQSCCEPSPSSAKVARS